MKPGDNLTGSLLVAHPCLRDPNFRQTIVFVSQHDAGEGASGFVLNRLLGECEHDGQKIAIFYGGPVETDQILLTSLQWRENPTIVAFRAFTGDSDSTNCQGWEKGMRFFQGYSGWSPGQLEQEIESHTWLVIPPARDLIEMNNPANAWREIMRQSGPLMHLLSEAPENPELN